jgi:tryptophanyl-tRNA synthetase
VQDKKNLAETLVSYLAPIRERREAYLQNLKTVDEIVAEGCARARKVACQTMEEVRTAMKLP